MRTMLKWIGMVVGIFIVFGASVYGFGYWNNIRDTKILGAEGLNCIKVSNPDDTVASCSSFLSSGRGDKSWTSVAYRNRADAYLDKGLCAQALQDANMAEQAEHSPSSHFIRGRAYECVGDYDRALAFLTAGINETPRSRPALYAARARLWKAKGDSSRAVEDLATEISLGNRSVLVKIFDAFFR